MQEMVLLFFVALMVLGPKKLPEVARALARGMREFKNTLNAPPEAPEIERLADESPPGHPPEEPDDAEPEGEGAERADAP